MFSGLKVADIIVLIRLAARLERYGHRAQDRPLHAQTRLRNFFTGIVFVDDRPYPYLLDEGGQSRMGCGAARFDGAKKQ